MTVNVRNSFVNGEIDAIPSKSYVHRILICRYLSGEKIELGDFKSEDMVATLNCLNALSNGESVLDCGESGSTLRFMLPLAGVIGGEYEFVGRGKLMKRPNDALFSAFFDNGVQASQTESIKIKGKLSAGEYRIRGDISSQYISGLLMALPTLDGDSKIILTTELVSAPYIEITLEVLKNFGIKIVKTDYGYFVKGKQKYQNNGLEPEGDWSNVAFFLALGAINGNVTLRGLREDSVQADRYIRTVLRLAGADIVWSGGKLTVKKSKLKAFTFDAEQCPDIVPISAVIASYADGTSVIKNVERLKIKESDRIESTIATLKAFGIFAEYIGKDLVVHGGKPRGGTVDSFNDHRIVMASAVMASGAVGDSFITGAEAVNKSYPTFFEDFARLGGKVIEL